MRRIVLKKRELVLLRAARDAQEALGMMDHELDGLLLIEANALAGLRVALEPYRETDV